MRSLAILALATVPVATVQAQQTTVTTTTTVSTDQAPSAEIGASMAAFGINHVTGSTGTSFNVGGGGVMLAFYLSDGLAIEPSARLDYVHVSSSAQDAGASATSIDFNVALPIYFDRNWGHTGFFIAPQVGLSKMPGSASQFSFGGGIGTKMRMSELVSFRLEGIVAHGLATNGSTGTDGAPSRTTVTALFGVSVFLQ